MKINLKPRFYYNNNTVLYFEELATRKDCKFLKISCLDTNCKYLIDDKYCYIIDPFYKNMFIDREYTLSTFYRCKVINKYHTTYKGFSVLNITVIGRRF